MVDRLLINDISGLPVVAVPETNRAHVTVTARDDPAFDAARRYANEVMDYFRAHAEEPG